MTATAHVDLREALALAWRGKWAVIGLAVFASLAAALALARQPSTWDATAEILIDPRRERPFAFDQVVGDLPVDNAVVASEIAVLLSRDLLARTVDRLGLDNDPEFAAPAPGPAARIETTLRAWAPALADWPRLTPTPLAGPARDRAAAALARAARARQAGRSYVIALTVRSADPDKSARIANALAETYVENQLSAKYEATRRASAWLAGRIVDLEAKAAEAETAVERYRAGQSLGDAQGPAVAEQQLAEINSQLVAARAARAEAEARHGQITRLIAAKGEGAAANVLSSPLILNLRQQRAEVKRREAELATRYGPKHPQMINVRAELSDIGAALSAELRKRVATLSNEVEVAAAREAALLAALSELEERTVDLSRASVGLRRLEREAAANRRIYEDVLSRYKETSESQEVQQADARVISAAAPPERPAAPRRGLIAALAGLGGGLAGLGLVFLGELMANTFRTAEEAQRLLGLPVLARIPRARGLTRRGGLPARLEAEPNSALAEAARELRTGLTLSRLDDPPRVALVTSAAPGEGKSTTCVALALLYARMGKRCAIVECDMRRPSLGRAIGAAAAGPDLIAALRGEATADEALRPVGRGGAVALTVNRPTPQAADILSSERFAALVANLRARFDLVLLDTPPALAVADAAAAARAADACLFLLRWNHTPRQAAAEALERLRQAGAAPCGVALSMVDLKREAGYRYGGYRGAAPDYSPYYA